MKRILVLSIPLWSLVMAGSVSDTTDSGEHWQKSVSAEKSGDYDAALAEAAAYARSGGDRFLAVLRSGWVAYRKKDYEAAGRYYREAMKMRPSALSPRLGLLNVARAQSEPAPILAAADSVLKVEPTNYTALLAAGWACWEAGNFRRSGGYYRKAAALYPESVDAMSGLAWCRLQSSLKREAREIFKIILAMEPDYPHAAQGLELSMAR